MPPSPDVHEGEILRGRPDAVGSTDLGLVGIARAEFLFGEGGLREPGHEGEEKLLAPDLGIGVVQIVFHGFGHPGEDVGRRIRRVAALQLLKESAHHFPGLRRGRILQDGEEGGQLRGDDAFIHAPDMGRVAQV